MGFKIREIETECTFSSALTIDALRHAIPPEAITRILAQEAAGEVRERKLTMSVVVWLVIALHLDATRSISAVLGTLACGLRFIWSDPALRLPQASALTYRRYQLGARPLAALFQQVCQPIATPQTRGAFRFGLRLLALDGTTEDVPDTPENAAAFGRHTRARGARAFPQVPAVYLAECGTHLIVGAGFWPCHTSARGRRAHAARAAARDAGVLGPWVSRLRHARWRTPAWGARLEPPAQPRQAAAQPYLAGWRGSGVWAAIGA